MSEPRRGRPRSESSRRAILEATRDILTESGYDELSIKAIAERSGTGRQTIYRWWTSKSLVVADVVKEGYLRMPAVDVPETSSLISDINTWGLATSEALADPRSMSVVRALISAASDGDHDATKFYAHLTGPNHQALLDRLRHGQQAGQLRSTADPQAIADALVGTVLFGILAKLPTRERLAAVVQALLGPAEHP